MLTLGTYCSTGSFFHIVGMKGVKSFEKNLKPMIGGLVIDTIITFALISIGLLALTRFAPDFLQNLPFAAKVTMMAGGATFFILELSYAFYRIKKISGEMKKAVGNLEKVVVKQREDIETQIDEENIESTEAVKFLEEKEKELQTKLVEIQQLNERLLLLSTNDQLPEDRKKALLDRLKDGSECEEIIKKLLEKTHEGLEYCRTRMQEGEQLKEEMTSETREMSKRIKELKRKIF